MTADLLSEEEREPDRTFAVARTPGGDPFYNIDTRAIWRRIEGWIRHRWGERVVVWTLQGPGLWEPRLTPTTITSVEVWDDAAEDWAASTARRVPMGYELGEGVYRVTATVGETEGPPPDVQEAFRRLAFYVEQAQSQGVGTTSVKTGDLSVNRPANWMAMAMQHSGAADMLRYHRRAA